MNPASPFRATSRIRNAAVAGLGVLALLSLAVAIVVANTVADSPAAEARTRARTQAVNPSPVAKVSNSPSPQAASAASPVAAGGQAGQQNWSTTPDNRNQGASIVYFRFRQWPSCTQSEPTPAIVEWKVTGAEAVELSVDNPGVVGSYGTYQGSTGEETLHISCAGAAGTSQEHIYTIYTGGTGGRKSATLTASVKVPQASPASPAPAAAPASSPSQER
jgi:hypothetical protein